MQMHNMKKHSSGKLLAALALIAAGPAATAQITTDNAMSPEELVQQILVGSGVQVMNVTYNGQAGLPGGQAAIGSFTSSSTLLPIPYGLVLSSGGVLQIPAGAPFAPGSAAGSDPDLVQLSGQTINDISILEFDFIPTGDTIRFNFVFASTEYSNYTCTVFNDAFGFFLSGPGLTGPFSNNAVNLAIVPNTGVGGANGIPITINTINSGSPTGGGQASTCAAADPNWQDNAVYYVNNPTSTDFIFNGLTVPLEAWSPVQCGETYHIKLAIGDGSDSALDSGVFLEGGSFTSTPFVPTLTPGPGIVGTNTILESCYTVQIDFERTGDTTLASTVYIETSGTATPGVDFDPVFPDSLFFPAGVSSIPFVFNAPLDADGTETIVLTLTSITQCAGVPVTNVFTFNIESAEPLVAIGYDQMIQCGNFAELSPVITGGFEPFTIVWEPGGTTADTLSTSPTAFTTYTATVTDTCGGQTTAQFNVDLIPLPNIFIGTIGPNPLYEGCQTNQINITRPVDVPGALTVNLTYSGTAQMGADYELPATALIEEDNFNVLLPFTAIADSEDEGNETVMITATFTDDCGRTVTSSTTITILNVPVIELIGGTFNANCDSSSSWLSVSASGGYNNQVSITWGGDSTLTGPLVEVPITGTSTYTVTATDECGQTATTSVLFIVDCEINVPNVFTPNNDGNNDSWYIEGIQYTTNTMKVFNRWGQVVYETNNYRNNWKAIDIPDGTYFYEIIVDRHEKPYTGHVTILRNSW
jgi:gliding motility-associated-like protein